MTKKSGITLEPTQRVISEMAARIYAAHVAHGDVVEDKKSEWIERSIRAALRIAKTVAASIGTNETAEANSESTGSREKHSAAGQTIPIATPPSAPPEPAASERADLDAVIDEALFSQDVPTAKRK